MEGVWKQYDPEVLEGYVGACALLEKGKVTVNVLGNNTIQMTCDGRRNHILPPIYITNVPHTLITKFQNVEDDASIIIKELSDNTEDFQAVYNDTATAQQKERVLKDVLDDWNQNTLPTHNKPQSNSKMLWQKAEQNLRNLTISHFPALKTKKEGGE